MLHEVLYSLEPSWLIGETTDERDARMKARRPALASKCYPGNHAGRVTSIRAVRDVIQGRLPSLRDMSDKDHPVVVLELDADGRAAIASHLSKIVGKRAVPVTFDDRWGALTVTLRKQFADPEVAEAKADDHFDVEGRRFAEVASLAREFLAPTVTHTGTGLYSAKVTPTHLDDTQSGAIVGQTVKITTGGLGTADAFKGGYVYNATRSELRAIVSHIDDAATLEGVLTAWLDTDDLDIYDAWSAIQAAHDQLDTDQGAADFTAEQRLEIYDGTYDEIVTFNASLAPQARYRLVLAAASGQAAVIVTNSATDAQTITVSGVRFVTIENIEVRCVHAGKSALANTHYGFRILGCVLDGFSVAAGALTMSPTATTYVRGTTVRNFATYGLFFYGAATIRKCVFVNNTRHVTSYRYAALDVAGCTFRAGTSGIYVLAGTDVLLGHKILMRHNSFYDVTYPYHDASTVNNIVFRLEARNNIFEGATAVYYSGGNGFYGGWLEVDHNCYYGNTAICDDWKGAAKTTLADWQAITDDHGVSPDASSFTDDPLLTDPANGDFSLGTGSPCLNAGVGAGVVTGVNGVDFDGPHPDVGAWSSGACVEPDAPSVSATDLGNQDEVRVDIIPGNEADVSTVFYQSLSSGGVNVWGSTVEGAGSVTLTGISVATHAVWATAERCALTSESSAIDFVTVAAANQYTAMRTTLKEWVKGVVGNPKVIWRYGNAPQPAHPYVSIHMGPTTVIGNDYHGGVDASGVSTVSGDREFVFSIQIYGKPSNEDGSASISMLERLRSSLEKRSIQASLSAGGVAFVAVEGHGDLAGIGGTQFEARVFMDIRFRTAYQDTDDVGYIGTVETPVGTLE